MPITTNFKKTPWKSILSIFAISAVVIIGLIALTEWANSTIIEDTVIDHTSDWDNYNKNTVSQYFALPDEAEIVSATETSDILGQTNKIVFQLPETESPEQWLAEIAEASDLTEYRENDYTYDAGQISSERRGLQKKYDTYRLTYNPESHQYEAVWGWD